MTREEAIIVLNMVEAHGSIVIEAKKKAIEALSEIEDIKAEIEQCYCDVNNDYDKGRNYGLYMAKQIIDNYL